MPGFFLHIIEPRGLAVICVSGFYRVDGRLFAQNFCHRSSLFVLIHVKFVEVFKLLNVCRRTIGLTMGGQERGVNGLRHEGDVAAPVWAGSRFGGCSVSRYAVRRVVLCMGSLRGLAKVCPRRAVRSGVWG